MTDEEYVSRPEMLRHAQRRLRRFLGRSPDDAEFLHRCVAMTEFIQHYEYDQLPNTDEISDNFEMRPRMNVLVQGAVSDVMAFSEERRRRVAEESAWLREFRRRLGM